ncbi:MAG: AbgT family transporter [Bacilli bacterium]|nr:AbgT family transporter [Bacilli bacterium]
MKTKKKKSNLSLDPIAFIMVMTFIIIMISLFLSLVNFDAEKTSIVSNSLETSVITVNNILTKDGIKFIFSSVITNLSQLEPFFMIMLSIISISMLDKSGFIGLIIKPFKKLNNRKITFITILLSLLSLCLGDYSYVIMLPLIVPIYKGLNKNPLLGLITVFLAITIGQGAGFIYNYTDYSLGLITEEAAIIDVDATYHFNLISTSIIRVVSSITICFLLTYFIEKYLIKQIPKYKKEEVADQDEQIENEQETFKQKFLNINYLLAIIVMLLIVGYLIIPGLPLSGLLLGDGKYYVTKLFASDAAFAQGFIYVILIISLVVSYVYGKTNDIFKNVSDFFSYLGSGISKYGYLLVLLFFFSQLVSIVSWTNIDEVIVSKLISLLSLVEFSGILLIIVLFVLTVIMTLIMPSTITKWSLMAPLIVPLFMRANITPDFTQFIYRVADGVGHILTPLFIYYMILIGMMDVNNNSESGISVFGTLKIMLRVIMLMIAIWLIIITMWYIIGLPIGFGIYPVL